jgi:hypothetical protein
MIVLYIKDCVMVKKYRQVFLGYNDRRLVGWVDNRMAKKRNLVTIKGYDGVWEILEVFDDVIVDDGNLDTLSSEYRHHRERTDV